MLFEYTRVKKTKIEWKESSAQSCKSRFGHQPEPGVSKLKRDSGPLSNFLYSILFIFEADPRLILAMVTNLYAETKSALPMKSAAGGYIEDPRQHGCSGKKTENP